MCETWRYLWRKSVRPDWLSGREETLRARFGPALAVISQPDRKWLRIEIACRNKAKANRLLLEFGGHAKKLPRDWLKQFARTQNTRPLKIGKRLVISREGDRQIAATVQRSPLLVIPAGAAFGTGEHATTELSLRLLEELTRTWSPGWSLVDLGTGSGILALAAKKLGARRVFGIDNDSMAISTAKKNARTNKLRGIYFQLCDVHSWKPPRKVDVVTANLFSELLLALLPKLRRAKWLIVSGILRKQEHEVVAALYRNGIGPIKIRRRGKWIALLARMLGR